MAMTTFIHGLKKRHKRKPGVASTADCYRIILVVCALPKAPLHTRGHRQF